jgi:thiol-disulfide isomerase/thioredoxin
MRTLIACLAVVALQAAGQSNVITVPLTYQAPEGKGPKPNFSPKGTQVALKSVGRNEVLPRGAIRPAKTGVLQVGPERRSWIPVLATASEAYPSDLTQLYIDANRNGNFADDDLPVTTKPSQNEKTKAWWSSFNSIELTVAFPDPERTEPYLVNMWIVREDGSPAPDVLRYSRGSWRSGSVKVNGEDALVAMLDGNNDAVYSRGDSWSVIQASMPNAPNAVLSIKEARDTSRLMFLERPGGKDVVLEFKSVARDGSSMTFAVVDRPVSKAEDRLPDDMVASERMRPRAATAMAWEHKFEDALAKAKSAKKRLLIDFETTWCGPCKTMDEWIWNDAEVVSVLRSGFVGVKLDGDVEKPLVARFAVKGYPTIIVVDPATARALKTVSGYQSSQQILSLIK